jgi:hypothetical protein
MKSIPRIALWSIIAIIVVVALIIAFPSLVPQPARP